MKKIFYITFLLFIIALSALISHGIDISAECAVVINAETKEIIFEKNAYLRHPMASTTKIMTSIIAIESGRLNDSIKATSSALAEGTSIGLKEGYIIKFEDLIYGMLLESGNDAANLVALHLGGSFENFAAMMNEKAREIGMTDTNFVTPSGLDADSHYSTANDMALLGAYSIKNPLFREICSDKKQTVNYIRPQISVTFSNHNRLLNNCEGVFGIKTGFTKKSGRCLVTACERGGATLVCVTLNAFDDWNDHRKLYDLSFSELNKTTIRFAEFKEVSVYGGEINKAEVYCDDFIFHFKEDKEITAKIYIPKIIYAPIRHGDVIGEVKYFLNDTLIHTSYIYSKLDINSENETFKEKAGIFDWYKKIFIKRKG